MKKSIKFFKNFLTYIRTHKIIAGIGLVLILGAFWVVRPKPPIPIPTQTVIKKDLVRSLSITGTVTSETEVNLSFPTSGKLIYVSAKEGDYINQWQVIASLDKSKLQATLRQAQQDFNAAKAAVEQVYNQTGRKIDLSFSEKVLQTAAEATQNKAYDNMVKAEQDLRDSDIISPIEGVLTKADVTTVGANVTISTVFTVTDNKNILFKMEVDEADISKVKPEQPVNVVLNSYPEEPISLVVTSIDFVTHTTSTGGNAYNVKAKMPDNSTLRYLSGMNGDAEIILSKKIGILSVPLSSLFNTNNVYVKTGTKYIKRKLRLGVQNDVDAEVVSGLSEGDIIVTDPTMVPSKK